MQAFQITVVKTYTVMVSARDGATRIDAERLAMAKVNGESIGKGEHVFIVGSEAEVTAAVKLAPEKRA